MANLQATATTDRNEYGLLDEEDERERVLLVVVQGAGEPEGATYAVNVATVREVIGSRTVTRVPGAPVEMRGLVNVRGMVVSVLDLAACLATVAQRPVAERPVAERPVAERPVSNAEERDAGAVTPVRAQRAGSIVLLEHGGRLVGLQVDAVRDVRPLDDGGVVGDGVNTGFNTGDERTGTERTGTERGTERTATERASNAIRPGTFVRGLSSAGGEVVTLLDVTALLSRYLISSGET